MFSVCIYATFSLQIHEIEGTAKQNRKRGRDSEEVETLKKKIKILETNLSNTFHFMLSKLNLEKKKEASILNIPSSKAGDSMFINTIIPMVFKDDDMLRYDALSFIKSTREYDIITSEFSFFDWLFLYFCINCSFFFFFSVLFNARIYEDGNEVADRKKEITKFTRYRVNNYKQQMNKKI